MSNVTRFRRKPTELLGDENPYMPSSRCIKELRLPPGHLIHQIAGIAQTVDLKWLGIKIPHCTYPDRFEAGVRHGLAHNRRTDIKTQFRPLFSKGFCLAKMYYKKFAPNHPLAAMGSFKSKIGLGGNITKIKDV